MKTYLLRSVVLSIVGIIALAPCARALTITHSATITKSDDSIGYGPLFLGGDWWFQPFDNQLGTLQQVTLNVGISADLSLFDRNHLSTPMGPGPTITYTPITSLLCSVNWDAFLPGQRRLLTASGDPIVLDWGESTTYQGNVTTEFSLNVGGTDWLSAVDSYRVIFDINGDANSRYGGVWGTATTSLSLTYTYAAFDNAPESGNRLFAFSAPESVGDGGNVLVALAGALAICAAVHRRVNLGLSRRTTL